MVLYVSAKVSEDYEDFLVSEHESHVRHTVSTALANLVNAGLFDRRDVAEAVRASTLRELAALWEEHGMSGVVLAGGRPALNSVPAELLPAALEHAGREGVFHFYRGFRFYNGFAVAVPGWDWRIVTVSRPMTPPLFKPKNALVLWLVPFVAATSLLLLAGILAVLSRNLQRPIATVLRGIAENGAIPPTGVREVDEIGAAITAAFEELRGSTERLRRSEEQYRTLTEGAQDLIFEVGPDLELRYLNRYAAHFFLAAPEALVGRPLPEILPVDAGATVRRDLESVLREGAAATFEWPVAFPRGEVWWNTRLIPLTDAAGRTASVMGMGRDITDRKRAEQALATEKERLAVTLRSIGDGVITCDPHSRVTLLNRAAETILGMTLEDAAGRPFGDVLALEDSRATRALVYDVKHLLGLGWTEGLPRRATLRNPRGERFVLEIGGSPIRESSSRVIGAVLVFRDVTQEQTREAEVQRAQQARVARPPGRRHRPRLQQHPHRHPRQHLARAAVARRGDPSAHAPPRARPRRRRCARAGPDPAAADLLPGRRAGQEAIVARRRSSGSSATFALRGLERAAAASTSRPDLWRGRGRRGADRPGRQQPRASTPCRRCPAAARCASRAENAPVGRGDGPALPAGATSGSRVADPGAGIPPEHLQRIFDPYFTTKADGERARPGDDATPS